MSAQVLIVGAGPVGLTLAAELARYGVAVRIVEKSAQRTDKSKALVLWSRTLELLARAGCSETFVAAGHKVLAANIVTGNKLIGHINISTVDSPFPYALMLPQSDTERLLEEHLLRQGVSLERQTELLSFSQTDQSVTSILRQADGSEETLATEWLVGCDGAHSTVRHGLGLSFLGDTLQSNWILADIHVKGFPFPDSEIATYWHEDGVLVVFPILPGRFRVIANIDLAAGSQPTEPSLEQVQAIMDRRGPGGMVASDPIWLAGFRINERKVADYRLGRVFVAGDAAHVHSPAGGQGMNTGMQDAFNLAWKLALVCRKNCADGKLLTSYSSERSAIGAQVLAAAGHLTAVAIMKNHAAQTVRNLVGHFMLGFAPVRTAIVNNMTEVSIGYGHSPLNGPSDSGLGAPVPGQRVAPLADRAPAGSGNSPRFVLFASPSSEVQRLIEEFPTLLDSQLRMPFKPDGLWLVRPDGYAACAVKAGEEQAIAEYLVSITGGN
ncbi:Pentachlorophenol 4-monooxygenase [Anatilimnocola aggregata]|uniref:Pentachlorophenol 4-monooxygenase n=1 Tax=Anatilimnocola aggregata TaxID=2528021 RepID=A0A517YK67_9BACT|nr:FAD-dependent monooxygenase [Anatilimnocola aggregata]QDU30613.1 Pentachlorophenol 4-monooxygenase [Anatilimnocola aggregata]